MSCVKKKDEKTVSIICLTNSSWKECISTCNCKEVWIISRKVLRDQTAT